MSEHTPGPWMMGDLAKGGCCEILPITGDRHLAICDVWSHEKPFEEQSANARLIAAAPDLLSELLKAEAYVELQTSDPRNAKLARQDLKSIRAAIAKATGEGA